MRLIEQVRLLPESQNGNVTFWSQILQLCIAFSYILPVITNILEDLYGFLSKSLLSDF